MKLLAGIWHFLFGTCGKEVSKESLSPVGELRRKELRETILARAKLVAQLYELSEERDRQDAIFIKHGLNPRTAHREAFLELGDSVERSSYVHVPDVLWDIPRDARPWMKKK